MKPIASKELKTPHPVTGLKQRLDVWNINIDAERERVMVTYKILQLSPNGSVIEGTEKPFFYERFNSRQGDQDQYSYKPVVKSNLKFDQLRESEVGKMISGLIDLDISTTDDGTPESLRQDIHIEEVEE